MAEEGSPVSGAAGPVDNSSKQQSKRRAACDECRNKKLKCTGEQPQCSRCARENITCVYSPQKQMGRPKKRARTDDEPSDVRRTKPSHQQTSTSETEGAPGRATDIFDEAFTPGGSMQPWLHSGEDWTMFGGSYGGEGSETSIPSLTPDHSASSSSPMQLQLPAELLATHPSPAGHHYRDSSTNWLLDSTLATNSNTSSNSGAITGLMPNCACLSTMYLTLNTLQSLKDEQTITFPFALHPLREAMQTAATVIACEECPTRFITAIQNVQLLGTLLMSISERFSKVLKYITSEAARAEAAGETKKFRLADLNTSNSHLHTGGLGCVAAFSLNLSPVEWRSMAKKVVRAEVQGDGNGCCCFLMGLIKQMEERQDRWHQTPVTADFPLDKDGWPIGRPRTLCDANSTKDEPLCLKLPRFARNLAEGFDWT